MGVITPHLILDVDVESLVGARLPLQVRQHQAGDLLLFGGGEDPSGARTGEEAGNGPPKLAVVGGRGGGGRSRPCRRFATAEAVLALRSHVGRGV